MRFNRAQEEPALDLGAVNDLEGSGEDSTLFDKSLQLGDEAGVAGEARITRGEGEEGQEAGPSTSTLPSDVALPRHKWHPHTVKVS